MCRSAPPHFLLRYSGAPRHLHSFPTRRSSDLVALELFGVPPGELELLVRQDDLAGVADRLGRSEEHTSELQSRVELGGRLLLEKKKAVAHNPAHTPRRSVASQNPRSSRRAPSP